MKRRKSTRETKNMIQTALWLPREMHEQLKIAGGERGLGDEIRRRLQSSFEALEPADKATGTLLFEINQLAALARPWHANHFAFEVFKAAINELLSKREPKGQAEPDAIAELQTTYGDDKPDVIGQIIARVLAMPPLLKRPHPPVLLMLKGD